MVLLVTIALVLIGAVSLIIGFIQDSLIPIYISIGCSVAAAVVLVAFSRMSRRQGVRVVSLPREELTPEAPAPASDSLVSESITVLGPTAAEAEPVSEEVGPAHEAVLVGGPVSHDEGGHGAEADEEEAEAAPAAATTGLLARAEAGTAYTVGTGAEVATAPGDEVGAGAGGPGRDATTEIPVAATDEAAAVTGAGRRAPASRGATKSGAKKAATKATPAKKAAARTTTAKAGTAKKAATKAAPTKKATTAKTATAKKAATKATPAKKAAARTTGGTGTRRRPGS